MKKTLMVFVLLCVASTLANGQNKKIRKDYTELLSSLKTIESRSKMTAVSIKKGFKPKEIRDSKDSTKLVVDPDKKLKDSLLFEAQQKYEDLKSSSDGIIEVFQHIILNPKLISEEYKIDVQKKVNDLTAKQAEFIKLYREGTTKLSTGASMSDPVTFAISVIRVVGNVYKEIKLMASAHRSVEAERFKKSTVMTPWDEI